MYFISGIVFQLMFSLLWSEVSHKDQYHRHDRGFEKHKSRPNRPIAYPMGQLVEKH
jgi:hypothetical protein